MRYSEVSQPNYQPSATGYTTFFTQNLEEIVRKIASCGRGWGGDKLTR